MGLEPLFINVLVQLSIIKNYELTLISFLECYKILVDKIKFENSIWSRKLLEI
jgi:hypothetical protein